MLSKKSFKIMVLYSGVWRVGGLMPTENIAMQEKNLSLKFNQAFEDLQLDRIDKDQYHDFVIVSGFADISVIDTQLMIIVNRIAFQSEKESE